MLQLKNNTPFAADIALLPNEDGVDTLYTTVKATFIIGNKWLVADEQVPIHKEDTYWDEPGTSSLRYASDIHVGKQATDVLLEGSAVTPDGKARPFVDVDVRVGKIAKTARVFGDRWWKNGGITRPIPFTEMPLVYERAFGGTVVDKGSIVESEERNPVGQFVFDSASARSSEDAPLPNVEELDAMIQRPGDRPAPVGFGPVAPHWKPRSQYAGTYDSQWEVERVPYLPNDFDKRFCNVAASGLIYPGWLQGGEAVKIQGMSPEPLQFSLPVVKITNTVSVAGAAERPAFYLDTLLMTPKNRTLSLVWHSALPVSKNKLKVDTVTLNLSR